LQDGEAYAYLLNALAPEVAGPSALTTSDPTERASLVLEQAEKLDCKRYLTPKDIVEGSPNLNLAFVAQIFQHRYGLLKRLQCANVFIENSYNKNILGYASNNPCFPLSFCDGGGGGSCIM